MPKMTGDITLLSLGRLLPIGEAVFVDIHIED
jgi:hypothetical protein